jgi:hypothetical protein
MSEVMITIVGWNMRELREWENDVEPVKSTALIRRWVEERRDGEPVRTTTPPGAEWVPRRRLDDPRDTPEPLQPGVAGGGCGSEVG